MPPSQLRAALVTLGCPTNQVDSEQIMGGLVSRGFEIVPEEEADIIVVNTCGFIQSAKEESLDTIFSVAELKEHGNLKSLVVAGCLAERYRKELEQELTEADAVIGLTDRSSIPDRCLELLGHKKKTDDVYSRVVSGQPHTAFLRISEGCDNRCSYCTIPKIRGPFRSLPEADIFRDAEELVSLGIRELVIIGQDTTRYGHDIGGTTISGLLKRLSDIDGVSWLRLMYTHPRHFTNELIDTVSSFPKVLPYIDMPVQHSAENVLINMGRHTTPEHIRSLIHKIRSRIEGVVLRTSLIAGFPGETGRDFEELTDFIREFRFERLGVFAYSPEEGTPAVDMDNQVPVEIAEERCEVIMDIQAGISQQFHDSLVGREYDMIIDEKETEPGVVIGRSYMDAPDIDGNITAVGSVENGEAFCRVRITGAGMYDFEGEIV